MHALANLGEGAIEILQLMIKNPRPSILRHAVTAIGKIRPLPASVMQKLRVLSQQDADPSVQRVVAKTLNRLQSGT